MNDSGPGVTEADTLGDTDIDIEILLVALTVTLELLDGDANFVCDAESDGDHDVDGLLDVDAEVEVDALIDTVTLAVPDAVTVDVVD